ncbi:hypothetical protein F5144DRAFT_644388 [Chaetomium tenue]|uniref:Uncharacterized protein n=1 Tax=Chaetomium tenue TaxID=1854479 RepID=A0ACB7P9W4_9PEZI|nr:hypothetical protein F5144DRAFT_644388 [Chaetomium globosum]
MAASDQIPETGSPSSLEETHPDSPHDSSVLRWLLDNRKNAPWNPLDPTHQAPAANDVEAYLARANFPGINPSWDYKTGIARSQPSRRALRSGGISRPSSTATRRPRRTPRSQSSYPPEQEVVDDNFPYQREIRDSDLTSEVPPELISDGTIDPALLIPAVPSQTTSALPPTATGDSAPDLPGPLSPPDHRGSGVNPSPAPLTPLDGPEMKDDAVEAMIRVPLHREFLNVDEDEAPARG